MSYQSLARAGAGVLTVITLLALTVASVLDPGIVVSTETLVLLVALIAALLGVDIAAEVLPLQITVDTHTLGEDEEEAEAETEESNHD